MRELFEAARIGSVRDVKRLLELGMDPNVHVLVEEAGYYEASPLFSVIHGCYLEAIRSDLSADRLQNYLDTARALIEHEASMWLLEFRWKRSALHWAVTYGLTPFITLFLEYLGKDNGLDVDCRDYHEDTPLHIATEQLDFTASYLLLKAGANLFCLNTAGFSAGSWIFDHDGFIWDKKLLLEESFERRKLTPQSMKHIYAALEKKIPVKYHDHSLRPLNISQQKAFKEKVPEALRSLIKNSSLFVDVNKWLMPSSLREAYEETHDRVPKI